MRGISQLPRCYGNSVAMATKNETLITPLYSVVLSRYLVWRFLGMTGISQLPRCYSNTAAIPTKVKS